MDFREALLLTAAVLLLLFPPLASAMQTWRTRRAMRRGRPLYRVDDDRGGR